MIVYLINVLLAFFLFRQEKGEKKPIHEGAFYKDEEFNVRLPLAIDYYNPLRGAPPPFIISPPKPERPEDFSNKAEMYRFPPIRPQKYRPSGRKSEHFLHEQDLN